MGPGTGEGGCPMSSRIRFRSCLIVVLAVGCVFESAVAADRIVTRRCVTRLRSPAGSRASGGRWLARDRCRFTAGAAFAGSYDGQLNLRIKPPQIGIVSAWVAIADGARIDLTIYEGLDDPVVLTGQIDLYGGALLGPSGAASGDTWVGTIALGTDRDAREISGMLWSGPAQGLGYYLVLTRPPVMDLSGATGSYVLRFAPGPSGCDCTSEVRTELRVGRNGSVTLLGGDEVAVDGPQAGATVGRLRRGSCVLSPRGELLCFDLDHRTDGAQGLLRLTARPDPVTGETVGQFAFRTAPDPGSPVPIAGGVEIVRTAD